MQFELGNNENGKGLIDLLMLAFRRMLALFLLFFALVYWVKIIGLEPAGGQRFDLMAEEWQLASVTLAVLFPVAAVGLWGMFSWGTLVWLLGAAIELFMYGAMSQVFGANKYILLFHLGSILLYFLFKAIELISSKRTPAM